MRDLTIEELALVSGGDNQDSEDIIVNGHRVKPSPPPPTPIYFFPPDSPSPPPPYSGGGGGGAHTPTPTPPADTSYAGTHLHVKVTNLTAEQQHAINVLHDRMNNDYAKVQGMDDNATMTIKSSDGIERTVTGAEAKSLFANMQVQIDPAGTPQRNGTARGSSTDANGITHFNIDLVNGPNGYINSSDSQEYQNNSADYLLFHELAHNTTAGKAENAYEDAHATKDGYGAYPDNEKFANTIADAIEKFITLNPLYTATYGYDSSNPGFSVPAPAPAPSEGGGGGGYVSES